jgi:hypothetical protein
MTDHQDHDGSPDAILKEAKEAFALSSDYEQENRNLAETDLRFSRLGDQWDEDVLRQRQEQGRPALTINKLPAYIRQVVNDARLNKPSIKVRPVDGGADVATAQIINGLIRNIEQTSDADIAYDTAADFAVTMGFGYFRVDVDFAGDDTFDQDIRIERVANPFNVFGDPYSDAADSSDWNSAFYVKMLSKDAFEREFKGAAKVDWESTGYTKLDHTWFDGEHVMVAEWWTRTEALRQILLLTDGNVVDAQVYEQNLDVFEAVGVAVAGDRAVKSHKITHRLMTGAEVLETTPWPGRYIPLVPVYGEEVNVEGKRYFRSLIRDAMDAQRMFNYWRTASTELVALAPKAPFLGPELAFEGKDARKWETANTEQHAFLAYAGNVRPERQAFAGIPAGALQEALNASDDMKSIMGLHDASMGARSNEVSGKAIMARQREGDVSTFHFQDNLARAIRHGGRVVLDLIPHVYSGQRIIRTLGQDGTVEDAQLGQPAAPEDPRQDIPAVYDLTAGKYDLTVESGPSFTTQRQEAAEQMMELLRVFPQAAPVIGDLLVKNLDWPGADDIAERLKALLPAAAQGGEGEDPRLAQAMQMVQQLQQAIEQLKADRSIEQFEAKIKALDAQSKAFDAETKRIAALGKIGESIISAASPPGPHDRYEGRAA